MCKFLWQKVYCDLAVRGKENGEKSFATLETYWKICWPLGLFIYSNLIGSLALYLTEGQPPFVSRDNIASSMLATRS